MFRFAVRRTDTDFPRLLMVETVFPMYRRLRKIIRSPCVVVTVEKNGMQVSVSAYCVMMGAVGLVTCVERFCPFLKKHFKRFTSTFFTLP